MNDVQRLRFLSIRSPAMLLALVLAGSLGSGDAAGAVITLKDGTRIGCVIIERDPQQAVVDVVTSAGNRQRKVLNVSDVASVDYAVSPSRLAELNPAKPLRYKEYAEELAEVKIDPEARPMALRLYHIALNLAPDEFAESCLLGMIRIARDRDEQRRLRAAAYLHLQSQDVSIMTSAQASTARDDDDDEDREDLLKLLRELRGRKKIRLRPAEITLLREALGSFAGGMEDQEITDLFAAECPNCQNGKVDCPLCQRGFITTGNRRRKCPRCTRGKTDCNVCGGGNGKRPLPEDLVARLVTAELNVLRDQLDSVADRNTKTDDSSDAWSQIRPAARHESFPALGLRNLTEFDPDKCIFRDGQWVEAD